MAVIRDDIERLESPIVSILFTPFPLRDVTVPNRIVLSPMCQFAAKDGLPNTWHLVFYGARAAGGVGMIMCEATAIVPEGRITPNDLGLWSDAHVPAWQPITSAVSALGAVPAIQLAHAGIKASSYPPGHNAGGTGVPDADGGWEPVGPTAEPFVPEYRVPRAMSTAEVAAIPGAFAAAASRALAAGFKAVEVHAAHGYLLNQFLSPLINHRSDGYGGDFAGRTRLVLDSVRAVRAAVGPNVPVLVRISATDWVDGGWTIADSVALGPALVEAGADLIDCSSGGVSATAEIPVGPGYQVSLSARIRAQTSIPTGTVGLITEPEQAETILAAGEADLVFLGRQLLKEPHWPLRAAKALSESVPPWPIPRYLAIDPRQS
jgi:2,4-dienoyl-CoA reductase-like NADH-dependent reductase (Old Yellow Enzyme family)